MSLLSKTAVKRRYSDLYVSLESVATRIRETLKESLKSIEFVDAVSVRVKNKNSFIRKFITDPDRYDPPFREIEDVIAARVVVLFSSVAQQVVNRISNDVFSPIESEYRHSKLVSSFDYEGYQSIHSIPIDFLDKYSGELDYPHVFELQVRTVFQHAATETDHELFYKEKERMTTEDQEFFQRRLACNTASAWGSDRMLDELHRRFLGIAKSR